MYIYIHKYFGTLYPVSHRLFVVGWLVVEPDHNHAYIYTYTVLYNFLHQDLLASEIGHRTNNYKSFRFFFPSNLLMSVTAVGFVASQLNIGQTFGMSLWSGCLM